MHTPAAAQPAPRPRSDPFHLRLCIGIGAACALVGIYGLIELWRLDAQGFSPVSERLPYWDFSNLWAGSVLALEGRVGLLFDVAAYRRELDLLFGVTLPAQEWSYPPSILLLGVPLALMPIWAAYAVWSAGTLFLFHRAVLLFRLPLLAHCLVLASPAVWANAMYGQNGMLTAALLVGGLALVPVRPVLAGVALGLLTWKPHLGVLVPLCLLAGGHWRAFAAAAGTAVLMAAATGILFGFEVWTLFLTRTRPMMTAIMESPYPQPFHTHAVTMLVMLRSLGADLATAYAGQAVVSIFAALAAIWVWRPKSGLDPLSRAALTGLLAVVAMPYGYTYDTAPLYLAAAWFFLREREPPVAVYALAWLWALIFPVFHEVLVSVGAVGPLLFAAFLLARHALPAGNREAVSAAVAQPAPATAS